MLVVLGVDAQKLNKYRKSPSVCVCFSEDPPRDFSPRGFIYYFEKIPPYLRVTYSRGDGDRFPQKIQTPRGGISRGNYGNTRV